MPDEGDVKTFVLPDAAEIMRRLTAIEDGTTSHKVQYFYPLIAQYGDEQRTADGVCFMLLTAMFEYVRERGMTSVMLALLTVQGPQYIRVLIDDDELRGEALGYWEKAMGAG